MASEPPQRELLARLQPQPPHDARTESGESESRNNTTVTRISMSGASIYFEDDNGKMAALRKFAIDVLLSPRFDTVMGVIIVINSATIGFELSARLEGESTQVMEDVEHVFLTIYAVELGLRFMALRLVAFKDKSVIFDCVLVFSGMLITWCLTPLGFADALSENLDPGILVVLRTLRLLRLARTVRLLVKFRELWMLVRSLMNSASTMFYVTILMSIILYILACVGCEVVGMHDLARGKGDVAPLERAEFELIVGEHFASIGLTMMTLVQFACLDSIAAIFMPLCKLDPVLAWYFMGSTLVLGIVLMNLITAVVVNSAMEQAVQDKELLASQELEQKEKFVKDLHKMFKRLDEDGSGQISRDEIKDISDKDRQKLTSGISIADPTELFDALDIDESGLLDIDEFCDGIWQVTISKAPIEIKRMAKQFKLMLDVQAQMRQTLAEFKQFFQEGERRITTAAGKAAAGDWSPPVPISPPSSWIDDLSLQLRASVQDGLRDGLRDALAQGVKTAIDARSSDAVSCTSEPTRDPLRPSPRRASPRTTASCGDRCAPRSPGHRTISPRRRARAPVALDASPIDASEISLVHGFPGPAPEGEGEPCSDHGLDGLDALPVSV